MLLVEMNLSFSLYKLSRGRTVRRFVFNEWLHTACIPRLICLHILFQSHVDGLVTAVDFTSNCLRITRLKTTNFTMDC